MNKTIFQRIRESRLNGSVEVIKTYFTDGSKDINLKYVGYINKRGVMYA